MASTAMRLITSAAPPMWSRCGWVSTSAAQPAYAELAELAFDTRLGRALVDEDRSLRHLDEDRVALADIEERDPQPRRWRECRGAARAARRAGPGATAAAHAAASGRRQRGMRRSSTSAGGIPSSAAIAYPELTWAYGSSATTRAHAAM